MGCGGSRPPKAGGGGANDEVDDDQCKYFGKMGHWARECRKEKRDAAATTHAAKAEADDGQALMMMAAHLVPSSPAPQADDLFIQIDDGGVGGVTRWIMDDDEPTLALVTAQANAATFSPSSTTLAPPHDPPRREEVVRSIGKRKQRGVHALDPRHGGHQPHDGREIGLLRARHRCPWHRQVW